MEIEGKICNPSRNKKKGKLIKLPQRDNLDENYEKVVKNGIIIINNNNNTAHILRKVLT